jgi:hypothetical protein
VGLFNSVNNQSFGTTLPGWVKLTNSHFAQTGFPLTEEELFAYSSLSPEDQALVDKSFGSLEDALARLEYATWWGWPNLDVPKITAEEAIASGWTGDRYKSARRLLVALAKEGYQHETLTLGTCLRLEEIKQERKRSQAQERQSRRRKRLSPEARAEIRVKDLQYRRRERSEVKKERQTRTSSA